MKLKLDTLDVAVTFDVSPRLADLIGRALVLLTPPEPGTRPVAHDAANLGGSGAKPPPAAARTCRHCREPIAKGSAAKYCSKACRMKASANRTWPRVCERCGRDYDATGTNQRYCRAADCKEPEPSWPAWRPCTNCGAPLVGADDPRILYCDEKCKASFEARQS